MIPENRILLVEDDTTLGLLLMEFLESDTFQVTWKRDALSALNHLKKQSVDLCLIDIAMPGMDGFCLAKQIKLVYNHIPFLFITARTLKEDKLKAYELGAEDYITKPFDADEVLCKIKVIMRRKLLHAHTANQCFELGDFKYYPTKQELSSAKYSASYTLTEKENQILYLLCSHQNEVVRREDAVAKIYGKADYFLGRSFDVFVSRLRKKLKPEENILIENIFNVGFILKNLT